MKIIAGNWKMNKTAAATKELLGQLKPLVEGATNKVIVCVPYTDIAAAVEATKGSNICVGAENVHWEKSGAFTGEISAEMLVEAGVTYVVIGHSERRQYFGETNATVLKRTLAALAAGLKPIVCIGETLSEREGGDTEKVLEKQVREGFNEISTEMLADVIVAYEPVWAIGTGKTATNDDANNTIAYIRKVFGEMYSEKTAKALPILYGGSMNEKNATDLLHMPHIDGGLVGGASLVAEKFAAIVKAF